MKDAPPPQPTSMKWVLTLTGVAMLAALALAGQRIWAATTPVVALFKQGGVAALKTHWQPAAIVAAEYAGALVWIILAFWLMRKPWKKPAEEASLTTKAVEATPPPPSAKPLPQSGKKRWSSCNVLQVAPGGRHLWQFDIRGGDFKLSREQNAPDAEPLPKGAFNKSWSSLWQPRLNVAWLPADSVFFRIVHLPESGAEETHSMLELQLEKLSPIAITQIVWSALKLPKSDPNLQTLVVVVAERKAVEEFLGKLEGQGYLADQLELPQLDQLQATEVREDGAWIYPAAWGGHQTALVAWWYGGGLQSLNFVTLAVTGERVKGLKDQLSQMTWAGELEGWLTSPPVWHLVAPASAGPEWEQPLQQALEEPLRLIPPLAGAELAARTARRAVRPEAQTGLMLPEYAARYHDEFIDRLWIRAVGVACGVWTVGVLIYFAVVSVMDYHTSSVEEQVAGTSGNYTNVIQLKAKLQVLKERQDLKYAGLDCWEAVAKTLPETVTLEGFSFDEGHRLNLNGTAPADDAARLTEFNDAMRNYTKDGNLLFDPVAGEPLSFHGAPGSPTISWNFSLELKRVEAE